MHRSSRPTFVAALKRLKLGRIVDTLSGPTRARREAGHAARGSAPPPAHRRSLRAARQQQRLIIVRAKLLLDPLLRCRLEQWDKTAKVSFDKRMLAELASLLRSRHTDIDVVVLGAGSRQDLPRERAWTHRMQTRIPRPLPARRRHAPHAEAEPTRQLPRRGDDRASPLIDLLILDDFALEPMSKEESKDVYQLFLERTGRASMIITSNRDTSEWIAMFDDVLRAQSAVDRFKNERLRLRLRHRGRVLPTATQAEAR